MNQKYFNICNKTVADLLDTEQGDIHAANNTLSKLLIENTDLKMFLQSTGKYYEYLAWIKKFKAKYNGIENFIKDNLELEEELVTKDDILIEKDEPLFTLKLTEEY